MTDRPASPRWYHEPWAILVCGLVLLPLGAYLLAITPRLRRLTKTLCLAATVSIAGSLGFVEWRFGPVDEAVAWARSFTGRQRAAFLAGRGDTAGAAAAALASMAIYPWDTDAVHDAGLYAHRAGNERFGLALLSAIVSEDRSVEGPLLDLAELYLRSPATAERGERLFKQALDRGKVRRDSARASLVLGLCALRHHDALLAEQHLRQVIVQFRRDLFEKAYRALAAVERERGDAPRELRLLCESLRIEPDDKPGRVRLDELVRRSGHSPVAFRAFIRAAELRNAGAPAEALALLQRLLARHPTFPYADGCVFMMAAIQFYSRREFEAALASYRLVVERHADSENRVRSLYQMGQCLEKLGRDEEAAATYVRVRDEAGGGAMLATMAQLQLTRMRRLGRLGGLIPIGEPGLAGSRSGAAGPGRGEAES